MNEFDQIEEEVSSPAKVSDEALEAAADIGKELANWTYFCTGISCPG